MTVTALHGKVVHVMGSASERCDRDVLASTLAFGRALVAEVLRAGGACVVLASREPRNSHGQPLVFDWELLDEIVAQSTSDLEQPITGIIVRSNSDHRTPTDRAALLLAAQKNPKLACRYIANETYTGESIRAVMKAEASCFVALGGGKGVVAMNAQRGGAPLLPFDVALGASLNDGEGAPALHRNALVEPSRYFARTHRALLSALPQLALVGADHEQLARYVVELLANELAAADAESKRRRPPQVITENIVLHPSITQASLDLARIKPWVTLSEKESLYLIDKLTGPEINEIKRRLELYGICRIRFAGQTPDKEIIEALGRNFGDVLEEQNDFKGQVKDIAPAKGTEATTGDSAGRLGPHVDGTQNVRPPALLIFQYVRNADYGSESTFWDLAHVFLELSPEQREQAFIALGHTQAGVFGKKGLEYVGPMATVSAQNTVIIRERFDAVVDVHVDVAETHEFLKKRLSRQGMIYLPARGDIVIFDNGRILHGREPIGGDAQRLHRRMWIADLRADLQSELLLGIRPAEASILAKLPLR